MKAAVLRPEPGNAATAAALEARGIATLRLPLFAVVSLPWTVPDPALFDALLLTSANAVRHAGSQLAALQALPVVAVGAATAQAARVTGLTVTITGDRDAAHAADAARAAGFNRLLHLAGREHAAAAPVAARCIVYASEPTAIPATALAALADNLALLHSARAARRLARLLDDAAIARATLRLACLSPAIAAAAGDGWHAVASAAAPTDTAMIELAAAMMATPD